MGNRTHGTVEQFARLDSFNLGESLSYYLSGQYVEISRVPNNYGGARAFFLCPHCGQRVRFLYSRWGRFRCRACNRLNYKSQQATRDEFMPYRQGTKLLRERFKLDRVPVPIEFFDFIPPRPKGMHWRTYWRLYKELDYLQGKYMSRFIAMSCAFLGWDCPEWAHK